MTAPVSGLLAIDKPEGMTSRKVVDRVQRIVRPAKAGHAGTLDPLATGVLVVCVGAATRLIPFVQEQPKTYRATFLLGRRSDTDDVTGKVTEVPDASPPAESEVRAAAIRFIGRIAQVPPKFSAVHVGGRRAYDLARRGHDVDLAAREVDVYRVDVERYAWPELRLVIECGSGTYVRSIGRDLGDALGCGAVMSGLARTAVGPFDLGAAIPLEAVDDELWRRLLPPSAAVAHLPRHICDETAATALRRGRTVAADANVCRIGGRVACVTPSGMLVAVAEYGETDGVLHPRVVLPE